MMDIGMKTIRRLKRGILVGFMALIGATFLHSVYIMVISFDMGIIVHLLQR